MARFTQQDIDNFLLKNPNISYEFLKAALVSKLSQAKFASLQNELDACRNELRLAKHECLSKDALISVLHAEVASLKAVNARQARELARIREECYSTSSIVVELSPEKARKHISPPMYRDLPITQPEKDMDLLQNEGMMTPPYENCVTVSNRHSPVFISSRVHQHPVAIDISPKTPKLSTLGPQSADLFTSFQRTPGNPLDTSTPKDSPSLLAGAMPKPVREQQAVVPVTIVKCEEPKAKQRRESSYGLFDDELSASKAPKMKQITLTQLDDNCSFLPPQNQALQPHKPDKAIRKRADRAKLNAFACKDCIAYYTLKYPDAAERDAEIQKNCKHRTLALAPPDEHNDSFYDTGFPSTAHAIAKGYMTVEKVHSPNMGLNTRQKRKQIGLVK